MTNGIHRTNSIVKVDAHYIKVMQLQVDIDPLYLSNVLILLRFQCQFNKYLLQLLVAVVDDELFEAIGLKHFEAIDIQHSHHLLLDFGGSL